MNSPLDSDLIKCILAEDDAGFDQIFPDRIRALSRVHWTPLAVVRKAAAFLVQTPSTRVLDLGCGPGKFCIAGALFTEGSFSGVEQRRRLCQIAWKIIKTQRLANTEIFHAPINALSFSNFDAFYLFNPFAEHLPSAVQDRIDDTIDLSESRYDQSVLHVSTELRKAPWGTRVVTYCGSDDIIPSDYECVVGDLHGKLRFWEKRANRKDSGQEKSMEVMSALTTL